MVRRHPLQHQERAAEWAEADRRGRQEGMRVAVAHLSESKPAILDATMADDRRGPFAIGALAVATGAVLFLAAGDVLTVPDKTFGAPRWLAAMLGVGGFFGGSYIRSLVLAPPWDRRLLCPSGLSTLR